MVQVVQIGGGGGGGVGLRYFGNKIQKNSYFFRETFPKSGEHRKHGEHGKDGKHQPGDLKHSIYDSKLSCCDSKRFICHPSSQM